MPPKIPDDTRNAIIADLKNENGSTREIAARHGVGHASVSRIASDAGLALDRSKTKNATEARAADNAASRVRLSARFLDEAHAALDDLHEEHTVFSFGGRENSYNEHKLPKPPTGDKRNLMIIAATAADKHMALERHDNEAEGVSAVDAWLRDVIGRDST